MGGGFRGRGGPMRGGGPFRGGGPMHRGGGFHRGGGGGFRGGMRGGFRGGPPPMGMQGRAQPSVLGQSNEIRLELAVPEEIINDPAVNFVGMMIGPGGSTQREMETQTGAKVNVRGKGCREGGQDTDPDKPMYVLIRGDAQHKVEAMKAIVMELFSSKQKREALKAAQMRQRDAGHMSMGGAQHSPMPMAGGNASGGLMPTGTAVQVGNGQLRELLMIPASKVGIVIGRGGETIQAIQRNSGANVQVQREHAPAHPETREVTITGTPQQIQAAKDEIQKHCVGTRTQPGVINATDHIMVPQNVVGIIIGRGGETIKRLQQQTEAGIQVQPEHLTQPGANERKVNLSGTDEQIAAAKREISSLVDKHRDSPYIHENVGHQSETVAVPVNCIGLIIGKGGDMVKQIAERTNTRIQVQKDDQLDAQYLAQKAAGTNNNNGPPTQFRNVSIRGDHRAIEAAKQELQAIVDEHAQRHGYDAPQLTQPMHQYFGMTPVAYRDYLKQMHDHYGMNEQQVIDYYQQALQQYQAAAAQYTDPTAAAAALQQQQALAAATGGVAAAAGTMATTGVAATTALQQQQAALTAAAATTVQPVQAGAVAAAQPQMVAAMGTQPQMTVAGQVPQQWGQQAALAQPVQQAAAVAQPQQWGQQVQAVTQQPLQQQWAQQPQVATATAQQPVQQFAQQPVQQQPAQQWAQGAPQQQFTPQQPAQQTQQQPNQQQWGNNQQQQQPPQQQQNQPWANSTPQQQQPPQGGSNQPQQQGGASGTWNNTPQQGGGASGNWSNGPQQGGAGNSGPGPNGPQGGATGGNWSNGPQQGGSGRGGGGWNSSPQRGGFRGRGGPPPDFRSSSSGRPQQRDGYNRNGDRSRRRD